MHAIPLQQILAQRIPYVGLPRGGPPPPPIWFESDELMRCEAMVLHHYVRLRRIFRLSAVSGSSKSVAMTITQFGSFIKACKIKVRHLPAQPACRTGHPPDCTLLVCRTDGLFMFLWQLVSCGIGTSRRIACTLLAHPAICEGSGTKPEPLPWPAYTEAPARDSRVLLLSCEA